MNIVLPCLIRASDVSGRDSVGWERRERSSTFNRVALPHPCIRRVQLVSAGGHEAMRKRRQKGRQHLTLLPCLILALGVSSEFQPVKTAQDGSDEKVRR